MEVSVTWNLFGGDMWGCWSIYELRVIENRHSLCLPAPCPLWNFAEVWVELGIWNWTHRIARAVQQFLYPCSWWGSCISMGATVSPWVCSPQSSLRHPQLLCALQRGGSFMFWFLIFICHDLLASGNVCEAIWNWWQHLPSCQPSISIFRSASPGFWPPGFWCSVLWH